MALNHIAALSSACKHLVVQGRADGHDPERQLLEADVPVLVHTLIYVISQEIHHTSVIFSRMAACIEVIVNDVYMEALSSQ